MGKQSRIWTGYLVFCSILVVLFIYLSGNMPTRSAYTWQEFQTAVEQEQIQSVEIEQNREIPTGSVDAVLKNGQEVKFYVSNVSDVEKLLQTYGVQYTLDDVPGESIFGNVVLPVLLSMVVVMIMIMFMNRSMNGGGSNAKMMNFGKSRAKLSDDKDKKITFEEVAGLEEEKEDLKEIVDFLKNPQK